jgi:hypothetical protein
MIKTRQNGPPHHFAASSVRALRIQHTDSSTRDMAHVVAGLEVTHAEKTSSEIWVLREVTATVVIYQEREIDEQTRGGVRIEAVAECPPEHARRQEYEHHQPAQKECGSGKREGCVTLASLYD